MNDLPPGLTEAQPWSLWVGQLGKGLVIAAITFMALSGILWILQKRYPSTEKAAKLSFTLGGLSIFAVFGCLVSLFIKDQFQYEYVASHGELATALQYKISGLWSAQQGSFLLWAIMSTISAFLVMRGTGEYRRWFTVTVGFFLASLMLILTFESPFNLIKDSTIHGKTYILPDGNGLTPSLQNYWMVIHPPTIFFGFGALTVIFGYAAAAIFTGNVKDWVKQVRPLALAITGVLGLGISMGGLWAYETLGWGGFWSWDPVENVSFVPWLMLVVFAHGVLVQSSKNKWISINLVLGALPFLSFVYGTFLTRSGLLDKVSNHSFATMDDNSRIILKWVLIGLVVGYGALYATRGVKLAKAASPEQPEEPGYSRESLLRTSMLLLSLMAVVIALGMSWPVVGAIKDGRGSAVEEWLYHQVLTWFFIPLILLMAVTPFLSWRAIGLKELWTRIFSVVCVSIGLTGFTHMALMSPSIGVNPNVGATVAGPFHIKAPLVWWMLFLIFLCMFAVVSNLWRAIELGKRSKMGVGGFIAHIGLAVLLGGLFISRGYERDETGVLRPGSPSTILDYNLTYKERTGKNPYDRDSKVVIAMTGPSGKTFEAKPGLFLYGNSQKPEAFVWPHVERGLTHDVYVHMAAPDNRVTLDPMRLKPGDIKTIGEKDPITLEYLKPVMKGPLGQPGARFGAQVRLTVQDAHGEPKQYLATPEMVLSETGLDPTLPKIGPDFMIAMAGGMDPADKSVELMLLFDPPLYPIKLFYKPLTSLVWVGTGMLFVGGLMAGYSRRRVTAKNPSVRVGSTSTPPDNHTSSDAPVPAT